VRVRKRRLLWWRGDSTRNEAGRRLRLLLAVRLLWASEPDRVSLRAVRAMFVLLSLLAETVR
jgi:hypothetical protein